MPASAEGEDAMNDSSTSRPVDQSVPLCELRGITKAFPGVVANDNIDLDL